MKIVSGPAASKQFCAVMRAFLLASLSALLLAAAAEAQSLEITTSSLPDANAGIAYSAPVAAANGTTPYAWSVAEGSLPGGLALDSGSGELSGTATLAETRSFVIEVTDAQGDTATRPFSLTVVPGAASQLRSPAVNRDA